MRHLTFIVFTFYVSLIWSQSSCGNSTAYSGEGTYYDLSSSAIGGLGNCSFDHSGISPFYIGAMNSEQYGDADFCGACAEITGPIGTVVVKIIDQCPECKHGDIDLSPEAFDQIAARIDGRVDISWEIVQCPTSGNIKMYYKEGSNQWWTAVQVRDHKSQISKLEFLENGSYVNVPRQDYNFFLKDDGMGLGPHTFRITDVYGEEVVISDVNYENEVEKNTDVQFSECTVSSVNDKAEELQFSVKGREVYFNDTQSNYQLIDVTGKVISSGETNDFVDFSNLHSGAYILRLTNNTSFTSHRINL